MGESIEYGDIVQEVRGAMQPGKLKLQSENIFFKNIKTGKTEQFSSEDIKGAQWLIRARGFCLKLTLVNGTIHRFDGLRESEYEKLSSFIKSHYNTELEKVDLAVKGWNWGTAKFKGNALDFVVGHHTAFEIPLNNVGHCHQGKNEVTLEFHQNDDAAISLMELRFHIPSDGSAEVDTVDEFYKNVLSKADIIQATGDAVAIFQEVQCLTPRGRYDIKLYPTFLQLHGKTFDYKISYTQILRLFLLPHKDSRQMYFVVSLDPPIKQGQTRYPFLILLFNKEDETTLEIGIDEEELAEKYGGKLHKEMSGPEYDIISRVMKCLVERKITVPGSFTGMSGAQCVACSYKAATGFIYPLERGFIFVHKPPLHIRFDEISGVNFARSSGSTRSFDFEIDTKTGTNYTFSGMEKDEYAKLYDFVTNKKLRIKNLSSKHKGGPSYEDDLNDSDDDHDAYLQRVKNEGRGRDSDDLDDDSDSSDEDFVAGTSGSDLALEYDSDVPTSTDTEDRDSEEDENARRDRKDKERENKVQKKEKKRRKKRESKSGSSKRKSKKKKDPNAPKKPIGPFFLWLGENRERIKEENPDIAFTDVGRIGGEEWKKLSDDDKKVYSDKHEEAKVQYQKDLEEYLANKPESESDDEEEEGKARTPKKKSKKQSSSPMKDTKAGSGAGYKSKEFISEEESSDSDSDSDEKPLRPKKESRKKKKKEKKAEASASGSGSDSDSDSKPRKRSKRGGTDEEDLEELKSDHSEEILSGSASDAGSEPPEESDSN